ncbi:MAG TPA: BTAD domain-containing putative transcriptional regulator [Ignavibacteria bacterium]|nr:BTAD domain-containing putative transcriptional regulator [Ignavibacteria bacterium]
MNNFLQSRLQPFKSSGKIVDRKDLIEKLNRNKDRNLLLICAPAGYGKSTLALEFLINRNLKYSWLNIHQEMSNFYLFINYLVLSIKKLESSFGKSTLLLIDDYREKLIFDSHKHIIISDIASAIQNDLIEVFNEDVYIVLDDIGNIADSNWMRLLFEALFANLPSNIHFIMTSRKIPDLNTGILNAKRNLLKIGTKDLAFNEQETCILVNELYALDISEKEIMSLSLSLNGWITGLHLILQSYGSSFPGIKFDKIKVLDDIFNYFSEDIFSTLSSESQNFLLFSSLLEAFTPELCDNLLNISNSANLIQDLLNQNIFIHINSPDANDHSESYSYQELFRRFLNDKIRKLFSKKEIKNFLKKAANYFESSGQVIEAVNYSILSGELERASVIIMNNFQQIFERGLFEVLWKWLDDLGSELVNKEYKLLYLRALLLKFFAGNIEESLPLLDKAIKLLNDSDDNEFLVKCIISKSRNLISLGRVSESINLLQGADSINVDSLSKAKLLFLSAYAYYQNSEYDKSLVLLNSASGIINSEEYPPKGAADVKQELFNLFGHIFLIRGDYSKSISYYERAIKNTEKIFGRYETICNLVLLYSQSGKFVKAAEYLEEARSVSGNISIPIFRITYLLACQAFRYEFGDYEESIRLLEEMNRIASELNHKYYIFLSYSLIGDSYYSLNKMGKAEEYYDLAFRYLNENNELERIQFSVCKAFLLSRSGENPEIEAVMQDAYKFYAERKMTYSKIQISFHLADFYLRSGKYEMAMLYLSEVLKTSEEKEYNSFIQREICNYRQLFDFAVSNQLSISYIKLQKSAFLDKLNSQWLSTDSRSRLLKQNESLIDIQLDLLGRSEVRIRGNIVADPSWSKKKWKYIFIYLMLEPGRSITKDKLIDLFYPDTPLESADNIFHQVISKFRNLIRITNEGLNENKKKISGNQKNGTSSAKNKKEGTYAMIPALINYEDKLLSISDNFTYYADSIEFEKLYRQLNSLKDPGSKLKYLKQAVEMYKGDFLEGNYDTWCEELRSKYRSYFISMSEDLLRILFNNEEHDEVLQYSENLLKFDKLNLSGHEYLIRSMIKINRPQIAKVRYSQLLKSYKREYDEVLPEKFTARFEAIVSGN